MSYLLCIDVNDLLAFLLGFPFHRSSPGGLFCLALNFSGVLLSLRLERFPKKFGMTHMLLALLHCHIPIVISFSQKGVYPQGGGKRWKRMWKKG